MNITAIDVGFSQVKGLATNGRSVCLPSVSGIVPRDGGFAVDGGGSRLVIKANGQARIVGSDALRYASHASSRRDPEWIFSEHWYALFCAALSELHYGSVRTKLVLGLPVADWRELRGDLAELVKRVHRFDAGRKRTIIVESVIIIPQPFGSLLSAALDGKGRMKPSLLTTGLAGVIDIGGATVNLLATDKLSDFGEWSHSARLGLLGTLGRIADDIRGLYPGIDPHPHEVTSWVANGSFRYAGQEISIADLTERHIHPLADTIAGYVSEYWPQPGRFDRVILTGGGAYILGNHLHQVLKSMHFPEIIIPSQPELENVRGYLKLGVLKWGSE